MEKNLKIKTNRNLLLCFFVLVILTCGIFGFLIVNHMPVSAEESVNNKPITIKGFKSGCLKSNNSISNERVFVTLTNNIYTRLYYKSPSANDYSFTTDRIYISEYENGWYYFYATTADGHSSGEYSIYYDDVSPQGMVYSNGNTYVNDCYVADSFSYSATDGGSGISEIYYKTPISDTYLPYSAGSIIPSNAGDGQYSFYAVDIAGNISDTLSIFLETKVPLIEIYRNNDIVYSKPLIDASTFDTDIYLCSNDILKISCITSSGNVTSNYLLDTDILIDGEYKSSDYTITLTTATGITTNFLYHIVHNAPNISIDGQAYSDGDIVYFNSDKDVIFVCDSTIKNTGDTGATIISEGNVNLNEKILYVNGINKVLTTESGTETKYILHLNDRAGNMSTITVFIDKCAANGVWETNEKELPDNGYTNNPLSFNFANDVVIAKYSLNGGEYKAFSSGQIFTEDGTYFVVLIDSAKNESRFTAHIKTVAPTGQLYANSLPVDSGTITNKPIYFSWSEDITVNVNGELYTKNSVLLDDNVYTFVLTDLAGNTQIYNITLDTTAPTINLNGISNGGIGNVTVTITNLSEAGTVEVYKDGVRIEYNLGDKLKDYGSYEIRVIDELGNERIYNFTLKYKMNGGAIALIIIAILIAVGVAVAAIILGKKVIYKRKFKTAPKLTDDELFEENLKKKVDENIEKDSNAE